MSSSNQHAGQGEADWMWAGAPPTGDAELPTSESPESPPASAEAVVSALSMAEEPQVLPISHPGRLVLGMASLAAERIRNGAPTNQAFVLGVGMAQETAAHLRGLADRMMGPPTRAASRGFGWATRRMPNAGPLARSRERFVRMVDQARERGKATLAAGREDADSFIRTNVNDAMSWAQAQAVPQIVDGLVPHLVDTVVPRLIDGVMPEIRERVLPMLIEDLANDPHVRDLVLEQSRGVVGEAAEELRTATAHADDKVEDMFRRLVGGRTTPGSPPEASRDG